MVRRPYAKECELQVSVLMLCLCRFGRIDVLVSCIMAQCAREEYGRRRDEYGREAGLGPGSLLPLW